MNYFNVINDSIEFIESEIKNSISLDQLSERANISKYHLIRIFKALTGKTPKEYIDERKLTEAMKLIENHGWNIAEAAFEYGFESHEVFSRRFKNVYGLKPSEVKKGRGNINKFERIHVVERDFTNSNNKLFPSFTIKEQCEQKIIGRRILFNPYDTNQIQSITKFAEDFVEEYSQIKPLENLYGVVCSEGAGQEQMYYFSGTKSEESNQPFKMESISLPASDYAVFTYTGNMANIYDVIFADVCTTLTLTGMQFNKTAIDLYELYNKDYHQTKKFNIYIPVR